MKKEFVPMSLDLESGKMKPVPPKELVEIEREEKELKSTEGRKTIWLKRDATFADLFSAEDRIVQKAEDGGGEDIDDPTHLHAELLDNFDKKTVTEVLGLKDKMKVIDYFQSKGYSVEDIETLLPIKFKKDKRTK